ncbi:MAG: oligomeric, coiled-coil, peripheral membrane protein [Watsoniomyces obsoletus]|nr:MAG: oligomeric, coiled-coil, peripheral membrane protein [Watsoniomyces obsoletus]
MSLQIFNAHSGARLKADPVSFESLDALRAWIARHTDVTSANQILITDAGKPVKLQTLLAEKDIFVYDRQLISPSSGGVRPDANLVPLPAPYDLKKSPHTLGSPTDLEAWRDLFASRRRWALDISKECRNILESAQSQSDETDIIYRAVDVAASNMTRHVTSLKQKFGDAQSWVKEVMTEQEVAMGSWQDTLTRLERLHVKHDVLQSKLFKNANAQAVELNERRVTSSKNPLLWDLIDVTDVEQAAKKTSEMLQQLGKKEVQLSEAVEKVTGSSGELLERITTWKAQWDAQLEDEMTRLVEDVEVVARKVDHDYEQVMTLGESSKSLSQASKKALIHTQDLLPSLSDNITRLARLQRRVAEQRNATAKTAVQQLQWVSDIESGLAQIHQQLPTLHVSEEGQAAFEVLGTLTRLAYIYGSVLVESVRRREWHDRVKRDSSALAEELAAIKDEEERRRRKWQRSLGEVRNADPTEERAATVEVNLRNQDPQWPAVERKDVDEYLSALRSLEGMETIEKDLSQMYSELDRPARRQPSRIRAFKNDSVHNVAMGRSSFLQEDNELLRSLREEKSKLEEKLKGSESRVRKLEDIVHRQSDMSRNATGNVFQNPNGFRSDVKTTPPSTAQPFLPSSRPQDGMSRRPSVSSRRFSSNQGNDERILVQKILSLEAEVMAEREQVAGLQKELTTRQEAEDGFLARIEEAQSTKKDLMDNLEAQQREFHDERRLLEDDGRKVKVRLEEVEDELDRLLGSREQSKAGNEERARALEAELEDVRSMSAKRIEVLELELEAEKNSARQILKHADSANAKLQDISVEVGRLYEELQQLQQRVQEQDDQRREQEELLERTHRQLLPDETVPTDLEGLIVALQSLARRSFDRVQEAEDALAIARAEKESLQSGIDDAEAKHVAVQSKLDREQKEVFRLRESLAGEQGRVSSLQEEILRERSLLDEFRAKHAEGESGSDELRERLAEEEAANGGLRAEIAAMQAEMQVFEQELSRKEESMRRLNRTSDGLRTQLQSRSDRAKDVSQLLYSFSERVNRLLETLGFMVSYQDGTMVLQRIPKASMSASGMNSTTDAVNSSTMMQDGNRTKQANESTDPDFIHWMDSTDMDEEARRYSTYLDTITRFDLDTACEAIAKRMKDTEHVARKWQKEARSYRERAHRYQSEAHEKIAYRSFREGDLALFLPTRNQATRPWAAFNVGAPHYFLREQDSHKLRTRDWLLARITKVEERMVDLSRTMHHSTTTAAVAGAGAGGAGGGDGRSIGESSDGGASLDDENPFELSDGLRWYLLDAAEEKAGAPTTPGLGKSTVASANVDAKGSIRVKKSAFGTSGATATKTLSKSLDSRRSSSNSKKDVNVAAGGTGGAGGGGGGAGDRPKSSGREGQISSTGNDQSVGGGQTTTNATATGAVVADRNGDGDGGGEGGGPTTVVDAPGSTNDIVPPGEERKPEEDEEGDERGYRGRLQQEVRRNLWGS